MRLCPKAFCVYGRKPTAHHAQIAGEARLQVGNGCSGHRGQYGHQSGVEQVSVASLSGVPHASPRLPSSESPPSRIGFKGRLHSDRLDATVSGTHRDAVHREPPSMIPPSRASRAGPPAVSSSSSPRRSSKGIRERGFLFTMRHPALCRIGDTLFCTLNVCEDPRGG